MQDHDWVYMASKIHDIALFSRLTLRRTKKEDDMPSQHIELLSQLVIFKEKITPRELSKIMGVNKTIISRIIEILNTKGFLEKSVDENDKRSYFVSITKLGEEALDKIYKHQLEPIYDLRRILGEDEFFDLINKIEHANMKLLEREEKIKE